MLNSAVHRPKCEVVYVCVWGRREGAGGGGGGGHRSTVDSGTQAVISTTLAY